MDEESAEGELSDEELLSDEVLEEAFNSEAEDAVSPTNDCLIIEGTKVTGIDILNYFITLSFYTVDIDNKSALGLYFSSR